MKKRKLIVVVVMISIFLSSCSQAKQYKSDIDLTSKGLNPGNLEAVKEALDSGANIDEVSALFYLHKMNPIYLAMENGQSRIVKYLIENGANPNYIDNNGISLLMYASGAFKESGGSPELTSIDYCEMLLKHGADINLTGKMGYTALDYAIRDSGKHDIISFLLDHGAEFSPKTLEAAMDSVNSGFGYWIVKSIAGKIIQDGKKTNLNPALEAAILGETERLEQLIKQDKIKEEDKQNILFFTAANGKVSSLKLLIDRGYDINSVTGSNASLLALAAESGNIEMVKYLQSQGLDINGCFGHSDTVLSATISNNQHEMVKYLLEQGADPMLFDYYDALKVSVIYSDIEMIEIVLPYGYSLNSQYINEAMHKAASNNRIDVIEFFIEKGVDIDIEYNGTTPLGESCGWGKFETAKFLIERGADVNGGMTYGDPLNMASLKGKTDIAKYLIEKGADVNATGLGSPLTAAISAGNLDIIKLLVENGADLNYKDDTNNGTTPIEMASYNESMRIREYIKQKSEELN